MKAKISFLTVWIGLLFLTGCSAVRVQQFQDFAQTGKAYTALISDTLDQAARIAIEEDSQVLLLNRPESAEQRMEAVLTGNELLKEKIRLFHDIRRHAELLELYFVSLERLAAGDASKNSGLEEACDGMVNTMGQLSDSIKTATIGNMPVSEAVGTAVNIVVTRYQRKALDAELQRRAQIIESELDLQIAAMTLISEQIQHDLSMQLDRMETDIVVRPYMKDTVSGNWKQQRLDFLMKNKASIHAEAAADAARSLKQTYIALLENRYTPTDISRFRKEIEQIAGLSEQIYSP